MKVEMVSKLAAGEINAVYKIWNDVYPTQINYADIGGFEQYLQNLGDTDHYLVTDTDCHIVGCAFTFIRDGGRWFGIIIDEQNQGQGIGTMLMQELMTRYEQLSGWVIDHDRYCIANGAPYFSPLNFYIKNGFGVCNTVRLETEQLSAVKIQWNR